MFSRLQRRSVRIGASTAAVGAMVTCGLVAAGTFATGASATPDNSNKTTTPIKHVVVLFDENVSFDHYFATYPNAANTDGTTFTAAPGTPKNIDTLQHAGLLTNNPNEYQPARLTPDQAVTCDMNHGYKPEQLAEDWNGTAAQMDQFVEKTNKTCSTTGGTYSDDGLVMDYYDGNTVTALWNYAQNYAMSDNSWDATYGPSTPGALNLISGQTANFKAVTPDTESAKGGTKTTDGYTIPTPDANGVGTVINDPDPYYDDCNNGNHKNANAVAAAASGKNVGDLLNDKGVTWGWFQGGFTPTGTSAAGYAVCGASQTNVIGGSSLDYSPHHNPFAYYASTANPKHLPPASQSEIGHDGQANHQYDLSYFADAVNSGNLPAVSFLKAPEAQDGHAAYSDPTDEQKFIVNEINLIEKSKYWKDTAIVISYDDSDGWYDHVAPEITNSSNDTTQESAICTDAAASGVPALGGYVDRCGPSQRLPLLVISPFAKRNYVDHTLTTQPSILKFIEDNWKTGRIGDGSFDATAGSLNNMFDFAHPQQRTVLLNSDGSLASVAPSKVTPGHGPSHRLPAKPDKNSKH